jgi:hypothetical protein
MVNYSNSKIYKIEGGSKTYIGSTTKKYLCQRWAQHKSDYNSSIKKTSAWELFDESGLENCIITLIETYPCKSKDELNARERYWIEKTKCVNKCLPGRSKEEYNSTHKQEAIERVKRWTEANKEKRALWAKESIECECGFHYTRQNKSRHMKLYHTG